MNLWCEITVGASCSESLKRGMRGRCCFKECLRSSFHNRRKKRRQRPTEGGGDGKTERGDHGGNLKGRRAVNFHLKMDKEFETLKWYHRPEKKKCYNLSCNFRICMKEIKRCFGQGFMAAFAKEIITKSMRLINAIHITTLSALGLLWRLKHNTPN